MADNPFAVTKPKAAKPIVAPGEGRLGGPRPKAKPVPKPNPNASQAFMAATKAGQKKAEYKTGGLEHALNKALPTVLGLPSDYTVSNIVKHPVRTYERQAAKVKSLDTQMKAATLAGDKKKLNDLTRQSTQYEAVIGPFGGKDVLESLGVAETEKLWGQYMRLANKDTPLSVAEGEHLDKLRAMFSSPPRPVMGSAKAVTEAVTAAKIAKVRAGKPLKSPGRKAAKADIAPKINQEAADSAAGAQAAAAAGDTPLFTGVKPTAEDKLLRGMTGAKKGYAKQAVARTAERSSRVAKAAEARKSIADPLEAHYAAKAAYKGELPKNQLNAVPDMTHGELKSLVAKVNEHPSLMEFQKTRTNDALVKIFDGGQPTPSEIRLIEHVFGSQKTSRLAAMTGGSWGDKVINAVNIPRSVQSALDISGLTRQAFVAMTTHPIIWGKAAPSYIKAFREKNFNLIEEAVKHDPNYHLALGHVSFSDMHGSLLAHEEPFASDWAARIPVIGRGIKGSAQGYQAFLNKLRMDMFSHFVRLEMKAGRDPHSEEFLKSVGDIVNAATGRGAIHGRLEHMMPAANTLLYSPRLMLSRLNYFDPTWYYRLKGKRARIEALKGLFATTAYVTSVVTLLSQIPGVKVGSLNPLSSDFGKLRQGDTHVDVAAGFLQYIHLAAMLEANAKLNATTGQRIDFGTGFGKQNRWDQINNFLINKASPPVSLGIGLARGKNGVGDQVSLGHPLQLAGNLLTPLSMQDAKDLFNQKKGGLDGITAASAGYGLSAVGLGVQTYSPKKSPGKPKTGKNPYASPSQSAHNPFATASGGSANPFGSP